MTPDPQPADGADPTRSPVRLSDLANLSPDGRGLRCRSCGCGHFDVLWTRPMPGGIRRCRACRHCGTRMFTRETAG